jgi:cell division protein FtsB
MGMDYATTQPKRRLRLRRAIFPVVGLLVIGYFAYHVFEGDRGIRAWNRLNQEIAAAKAERNEAQNKSNSWTRRVNSLRRGTIDEDMLDERARVMLNYARKDEIVILYRKPLTEGNGANRR